MEKQKYTTVALKENQYLVLSNSLELFSLLPEIHCVGFTDNIRDHNLDGFYFKHDLINYTKFW